MARSNNINDIKEILKNIFNEKNDLPDFNIVLLKRKWIQIIGEKLYLEAIPKKIINKKLIIFCKYQGLLTVLPFYKNEILDNIKKHFNELIIDDVVFTLKEN